MLQEHEVCSKSQAKKQFFGGVYSLSIDNILKWRCEI
jgi:hypothetical protein